MTALIQPLSAQVNIVDDKGRPTPQFIQLLQKLSVGTGLTKDAAGNVTFAAMAAKTILANKTTGSAAPTACTIDDILDFVAGTAAQGDILFRGASGYKRLPAGTSGQFLKTLGPGVDPVWATAGGGGGGSTPTIRSFTQASSSWSSISIPWPTGTVAGDIVVIFAENGFQGVTYPTSWTQLNANNANWTNFTTAAKVMTAADITAGSVTVTTSGNYNGYYSAVCITGTSVTSLDNSTGSGSPGSASQASWPIIGLPGIASTDLVVGFFATRGTMTPTVSSGLTLLTPVLNAANASGGVFTVNAAAIGKLGINELVTLPVGNNGACMSLNAFK